MPSKRSKSGTKGPRGKPGEGERAKILPFEAPAAGPSAAPQPPLPETAAEAYVAVCAATVNAVRGDISHEEALQLTHMASLFRKWSEEGLAPDLISTLANPSPTEISVPLEELLQGERAHPDPERRAATIAMGALQAGGRYAIELADKALSLDPASIDAQLAHALEIDDLKRRLRKLRSIAKTAETQIGQRRVRDVAGDAWAHFDVHPYLRAQYYVAHTIIELGRFADATRAFEDLLETCGDDFLVARRQLVPLYLILDRVEDADLLLCSHFADTGAVFAWARPLVGWAVREFEAAHEDLATAREDWPEVEKYLFGVDPTPPDEDDPDFDVAVESAEAGFVLRIAWQCRPLALGWLQTGGNPGDGRYLGALTVPEMADPGDLDIPF